MKKIGLLSLFLVIGFGCMAQGYWKRVHGDGITEVPSAEGTYSPTNSPYAIYAAPHMVDSSGTFWLYGGGGGNALWRFNPEINQWMIVDGDYDDTDIAAVYGTMGVPDPANTPGASTFGHPSWGDHQGNLWLYGVNGLNDMWKFDISMDMWTWVKGTASTGPAVYGVKGVESPDNLPGTVNETDCHWTDSEGKLWLYTELDGNLWVFDPDTEMWTWISGEGGDPDPIFGTLDVFAPENTPGGFSACPAVGTLYSMWITSDDHLWMLVNRFTADLETEVWEFDPVISQWRCRRIDVSEFAATQVYPESCVEDSLIHPIARTEMRADWVDDCDRLYMFGGGNFCTVSQGYNDVWRYDPATNNFTYLKGGLDEAVYGVQGVFDADNLPNAVLGSQAWQNEQGFYMMGGQDPLMVFPDHSVWLYSPDTTVADFTFEVDCYDVVFSNESSTGCNSFKSFFWDFGDGATSEDENPVHTYGANGTYEVSLVVVNCSWSADTINYFIDIECAFEIELESDTICEGDCYLLVATSVEDTDLITFEWDNDIPDDNDSIVVCPLETTEYRVIATNITGEIDTAWTTLTVIPEPVVDLGPDTALCEGPYILDALNPGATYLWNYGSTEQTLLAAVSGTYFVDVGFGSCIVRDSVEVIITGPVVNLGPDLFVCSIDTLLDAGMGEGYTYLWQDGSTGQLYTLSDTGTFHVTVTDSVGCVVSDTLFVYPGTITVDLGPDTTFCHEVEFTLDAGFSEGTYFWNDGSAGRYLEVVESGSYSVTVSDGYCEETDSILIDVRTLVTQFSVDDTVGCYPLVASFTDLSPSPDIVGWSWSFGDGAMSEIQHPTHEYASTGTYEVSLVVTDSFGCSSEIDRTVTIEIYPQPEAFFSFTPESPEVDFEVSFQDESIDALAWNWSFGDGYTSDEQHPKHTYLDLSNFDVELIVSNNLCVDSLTKTIIVSEALMFYVPNVFTPDGDGYNNTFFPVFTSGFDPYDYHLTIFNRWGEIVFESYDVNVGWDGTYPRCGLVQDGVYVWQIEVGTLQSPEKEIYRGHVTVLK